MTIAAKVCEALGIACMMIGLVQGILSQTMWMELYLSIIGIAVFLAGWGLERGAARTRRIRSLHDRDSHARDHSGTQTGDGGAARGDKD